MIIRMLDTIGKLSTNRTSMRVLVIGATGLLGRVLLEEWDENNVTGVGSRDVDVQDESQLRPLFGRCRPEWTILAAAYTDVGRLRKGSGARPPSELRRCNECRACRA